jgi:putative flavoprotein involved in K+ transport
MKRVETVIIGAGQAGLAMSRCLTDLAIDHVLLERGRVAERWRSERWDSLRLLTPNWQTRLPWFGYDGPEPDGFMTMPEVVGFLNQYAQSFNAPVEAGTTVLSVAPSSLGFRAWTNRDTWVAGTVVIATGHCDVPFVPAAASRVPARIHQLTPAAYRNPSQLPEGGVLVVGASASGIQLAEEIHLSGRPVTLSVGSHTRVPRRYRGRDIMWWLDRAGILGQTAEEVHDVEISRAEPSLQLVGRDTTLDLSALRALGVRVAGRLLSADRDWLRFADDVASTTVAADIKLAALLQRLDEFATHIGESFEQEPFTPIWPLFMNDSVPLTLRTSDIRTIVWATGYRRAYRWLQVPVLDSKGEIRHRGGVTPFPGLYAIGLYFLRQRNSNFIDGVGADAFRLAEHVQAHLDSRRTAIA